MRKLLGGLTAALFLASVTPAVAQAPSARPPPPPAGKDEPRKDKPKDEKKKDDAVAFGTEVMVLHATNKKKGIDPRIGNMPELKKPPFSSYDSYELLTKTRLPLGKEDRNLRLPNGRVLRTKLLEVLPDKEHVRLSASINQPKGKTFLPLLEVKAKVGQAFIVAGQRHKGGILVLVIRVVK